MVFSQLKYQSNNYDEVIDYPFLIIFGDIGQGIRYLIITIKFYLGMSEMFYTPDEDHDLSRQQHQIE